MQFAMISAMAGIRECVEHWDQLARHAANADLFTEAGWFNAWCDAFGAGKQPLVLVARDETGMASVFPLVRSRTRRRPWFSMHHCQPEDLTRLAARFRRGSVLPVTQLTPAASIDAGSVRGGWMVRADAPPGLTAAMFDVLAARDDWDLIALPAVPEARQAQLEHACAQAGLHCHVADSAFELFGCTPQRWEDFLAAKSRHFRKRMQWAERDLNKLGRGSLATLTEPSALAAGLNRHFVLADLSWKAAPRAGQKWWAPQTESTRRFLRRLVSNYLQAPGTGRGPVIHQLEVDGALVASLLSVVSGRRLYAIQTFFDPRYAGGSPGRVLIGEMLKWAAAGDLDWVDFNGNSSLVQMFAKEPQRFRQAWIFRRPGYAGLTYHLIRQVDKLMQARSSDRS